jgi:hypothetical protein
MKHVSYLVLFILLPTVLFAQKPLTPEATKVRDAYEWLLKQSNLPENQLLFIRSFPDNKDAFIETFTPHTFDQLYFKRDLYLAKYHEFGRMYPKQVLTKSVGIGKKLHVADGPAAEMQKSIIEIANSRPEVFVTEMKGLNKKERIALVTFMADIKDHNNFPQYQQLIDKLVKIEANNIADMLIEARDVRMRQAQ